MFSSNHNSNSGLKARKSQRSVFLLSGDSVTVTSLRPALCEELHFLMTLFVNQYILCAALLAPYWFGFNFFFFTWYKLKSVLLLSPNSSKF